MATTKEQLKKNIKIYFNRLAKADPVIRHLNIVQSKTSLGYAISYKHKMLAGMSSDAANALLAEQAAKSLLMGVGRSALHRLPNAKDVVTYTAKSNGSFINAEMIKNYERDDLIVVSPMIYAVLAANDAAAMSGGYATMTIDDKEVVIVGDSMAIDNKICYIPKKVLKVSPLIVKDDGDHILMSITYELSERLPIRFFHFKSVVL